MDLSIETIHILVYAKLLFSAALVAAFFAWRRHAGVLVYAIMSSLALAGLASLLLLPLHSGFWGNSGDENFMHAFFQSVVEGHGGQDFYYRELPPFYPPLYFWLVGTIARPFVETGVDAAHLGVVLTLLVWTLAPILLARLLPHSSITQRLNHSTTFLASLLLLLLLDFDAVILKPFEALTALLGIVWIAGFAHAVEHQRKRAWIALGLTGGLLFLTYYFWWFIFIPIMLWLVIRATNRRHAAITFVATGTILFLVTTPYLLPLLQSFWKFGVENWQAVFFVPNDVNTFAPWFTISWSGAIATAGLIGLIALRSQPLVRTSGMVLLACYLYQGANLLVLALGGQHAQMSKPFYFLGGAALAVGAAALLEYGYHWIQKIADRQTAQRAALVVALLLLPATPFVRFLDEPLIRAQIEKDRAPRGEIYLAENIRRAVPDYAEHDWLTSGTNTVNGYIALPYYLASNPHFSHQASQYSQRFAVVQEFLGAPNAATFTQIADTQTSITALLFFKHSDPLTYPMFFWEDRFPNGGREQELLLRRDLVSPKDWKLIHEDRDWVMFVRTK